MGDLGANLPKPFCRLLQWMEWGNLTVDRLWVFFPASCMFVLWLLLKTCLACLWIYCASFSRKTLDFPRKDWLNPKYLNVSNQFTTKLCIYFKETSNMIYPKLRFPRQPRDTKTPALIFTIAEHPNTSTALCSSRRLLTIYQQMVGLTFSTLCWQIQLRLHLQYLKRITSENVFHFQRATLLLGQSYHVKQFLSASPSFLQTSAG